MEKSITKTELEHFDRAFHEDRINLVAMNAVTANGVQNSAKRRNAVAAANHQYSVRLDPHGVTNQKSSGRCWMFAALNCMRFQVIQRLNLERFELSQNFTLFYDKLEKANYFLENILATLDEPLDSRYIEHLLKSPEQDGGQWDMISALVAKYGVVPKEAMPESACSSATKEMNTILTEKLREDAAVLRVKAEGGADTEQLRAEKKEMLRTIYRMLCICLGTPPETFDFEIRTKDGLVIRDCAITPLAFYQKYVQLDLSEYISLINAPTQDKPYGRTYTVKYLGNVVGGSIRYLNLPMEELKALAIQQLKDGELVWFGSDVGKFGDRKAGIWDTASFRFGEVLGGLRLDMTKEERLDHRDSAMNHAMVICGVNLDDEGRPNRWKIENSWGEDAGQKGYYVASDAWFDEYTYQVIIHKKYLKDEWLKALAEPPIELEPWDPMGTLA